MSRGPVAIAVNADVGTVGIGVSVVLLSVDVWPSRIVLHVAARQSDRTDELQVAWQSGFDAWVKAGADGQPPRDPAWVLYQDLHVELEDAAGAAFELVAAQSGGQHTEWSSTRVYQPAPKDHLTLTFDRKSGRQTVVIPLAK